MTYLDETSIRSWLFTTDHKRIGLLYMVSIAFKGSPTSYGQLRPTTRQH